jgi:murein DD-endopeptidase MepM/ murein hydrolase activator NlpD
VRAPFNASGFGKRVDPFTGQLAMHEGIDFLADAGSQVVAAAGGVVVFAGFHPQYGYVIDIDHGNDLVTRYAHCSKLLVKEGDVVARGRKISEVGSTGRSTGPHLHFEVRFRGVAQNPSKFLLASVPAARGSTKVATAKAPSESARPAEESAKAVAPAPATEASKVPAESAKAASDE